MKKLKRFPIFAAMLLIAMVSSLCISCSSDDGDDTPATDAEDLVGFWLYYGENDQYMEEYGFFADGTCNYTESYEPDDETEESEYEFAKGTYTVKGDKLTMKLNFGDETETWVYTIVSVTKGRKLVLKDDEGDTQTFDFYKE